MEDGHSDVSKPPVPPACVPGAESDKTIHVSSRAEDAAAGHSSAGAGTGVNDSTHSSHGQFECNVCFEDATDPVITRCGHLFCWPCLFRWMQHGHNNCPVCKAGVTRDTVIPLYGRGADQDTRRTHAYHSQEGSIPSRPAAERPPEPQQQQNGMFGPNVQFQAGFGFFPSLFGLQFQHFTQPPASPDGVQTAEELQSKRLASILYGAGGIVLFMLLCF